MSTFCGRQTEISQANCRQLRVPGDSFATTGARTQDREKCVRQKCVSQEVTQPLTSPKAQWVNKFHIKTKRALLNAENKGQFKGRTLRRATSCACGSLKDAQNVAFRAKKVRATRMVRPHTRSSARCGRRRIPQKASCCAAGTTAPLAAGAHVFSVGRLLSLRTDPESSESCGARM